MLALAYSITDLPGCAGSALQPTSGTVDRPVCAMVSAWASFDRGNRLSGQLSGMDEKRVRDHYEHWERENGLPHGRLDLWIAAINGQSWSLPIDPVVGDLTLDPYQLDAIAGLSVAGGLLGLFMGAGKTAIGIAIARAVGKRCWVFCPLSAQMTAWEPWRPLLESLGIEFKVISIDSAHKYTSVRGDEGGLMIVDEAHNAGGKATRRTKAVHEIRLKFDYGVCLTGSAATGGVEKCLSMKDLAVPGLTGFASTWKAGEHFKCLVKKKIGARTVTSLEEPSSQREQFMAWFSYQSVLMRPRCDAVRASFQLPEQSIQEIHFGDPWPKLDREVARVAKDIFTETGTFPHAQEVMHVLAGSGVESKSVYLADVLAAHGDPAVVFANYRASLDAVGAALTARGILYVRVDGDVTGNERGECERRFQSGEVLVFLGQIHAASIALNLFRARVSFTVDVSQSAIDYEQALARTCRRGQQHECVHVDLVANRLQAAILDIVRKGADFNAAAADWSTIKRELDRLKPLPGATSG